MLVKISVKNQIAIPKAVLERAGLGPNDVYFDIEYEKGHIVLTPMQVEEKIAPEALMKFEEKMTKIGPQDHSFKSIPEVIKHLRSKPRR